MGIKPLNMHYSMENAATIYDEESLTALQLAGRTAGKVNECVEEVNKIPTEITKEVQRQINNGTFDNQIDEYAGQLKKQVSDSEAKLQREIDGAENRMETRYNEVESSLGGRINNLLGNVHNGATSMDAEIIDARVNEIGHVYNTLGEALRDTASFTRNMLDAQIYCGGNRTAKITKSGADLKIELPYYLTFRSQYYEGGVLWGNSISDIVDYIVLDGDAATITLPKNHNWLYNYKENKYKIQPVRDSLSIYDVLVLQNAYANPTGGALLREQVIANTWDIYCVNSSFVYMGSDNDISFTRNVEKGCLDVHFTSPAYARSERGSHALTWRGECIADIADSIVVDGESATISIKQYEAFGINKGTNKYFIKPLSQIGKDDLVGLTTAYWWPVGGSLLLEYAAKRCIEFSKKEAFSNPNEKLQTFATRFNNTTKTDSFLFFTDPHVTLAGEITGWEGQLNVMLSELENVYRSAPFDFCLSGGDWLNSRDTAESAFYKLSYIAGQTRARFENFRHILGNHDTNYQGTAQLTNAVIANMWFRNEGKTYYKFTTKSTTYFVFDCGIDWNHSTLNEYDNEQLTWFKDERKKVATENIVILAHMYTINSLENLHPLATAILAECAIHNSSGIGSKVRYYLAGHQHEDIVTDYSGIPVVITTNARENGLCADMVLADYDNNKLHLVRYGTGEDRTVDI